MNISQNASSSHLFKLRDQHSLYQVRTLRARIAQFEASGSKAARCYAIAALATQVILALVCTGFIATHLLHCPSPIPIWGSVIGFLGAAILFSNISSRFSKAAATRREAHNADVLALELINNSSQRSLASVGELPAIDKRIAWHRHEEKELRALHPESVSDVKRRCDALGLDAGPTTHYAAAKSACSIHSSSQSWDEVRSEISKAKQTLKQDPTPWNDARYQGISRRAYQQAYAPSEQMTWTAKDRKEALDYLSTRLQSKEQFAKGSYKDQKKAAKELLLQLQQNDVQDASPQVVLCAIAHLKVCLQTWNTLKTLWQEYHASHESYSKLPKQEDDEKFKPNLLFNTWFTTHAYADFLSGYFPKCNLEINQPLESQLRLEICKCRLAIAQSTMATGSDFEQAINKFNIQALQFEIISLQSEEKNRTVKSQKELAVLQIALRESFVSLTQKFECLNDSQKIKQLGEKLQGVAWLFQAELFYAARFQDAIKQISISFDSEAYLNNYCKRLVQDEKQRISDSLYQSDIDKVKASLSDKLKLAIQLCGQGEAALSKMKADFDTPHDRSDFAKAPADGRKLLRHFLAQDRALFARQEALLNLLMIQQRLVNRNKEAKLTPEELVLPEQIGVAHTHQPIEYAIPNVDREIVRIKACIAKLEQDYQTHEAGKTDKLTKINQKLSGARQNAISGYLLYLEKQPVAISQYFELLNTIEEKHLGTVGVAAEAVWSEHDIAGYQEWRVLQERQLVVDQKCKQAYATLNELIAIQQNPPPEKIKTEAEKKRFFEEINKQINAYSDQIATLALVDRQSIKDELETLLNTHSDLKNFHEQQEQIAQLQQDIMQTLPSDKVQLAQLEGELQQATARKKTLLQALSRTGYTAWEQRVRDLDPNNPQHAQQYQQALLKMHAILRAIPHEKFSMRQIEKLVKHTMLQKSLSKGYRDAVVQRLQELKVMQQIQPAQYVMVLTDLEKRHPVKLKEALRRAWKITEIEGYHTWKAQVMKAGYQKQDDASGRKFHADVAKFHKLFAKVDPECFDLGILQGLVELEKSVGHQPAQLKPSKPSMSDEEFVRLKSADKASRLPTLDPADKDYSQEQRKQLIDLWKTCQKMSYAYFSENELNQIVRTTTQPVPLYGKALADLETVSSQLEKKPTWLPQKPKPISDSEPDEKVIKQYQNNLFFYEAGQKQFAKDLALHEKAVNKLYATTGYRGTLTFKSLVAELFHPHVEHTFFFLHQDDLSLSMRHVQKIEAGIPPLDRSRKAVYLYVQVLVVNIIASLAFGLALIYAPSHWVQLGLVIGYAPVLKIFESVIKHYMRSLEHKMTQRRVAVYLYQKGVQRVVSGQGMFAQSLDGTEWTRSRRLMQTPQQNIKEIKIFRKKIVSDSEARIKNLDKKRDISKIIASCLGVNWASIILADSPYPCEKNRTLHLKAKPPTLKQRLDKLTALKRIVCH